MQLDMFPSPDYTPHHINLAAIARGVFKYEVTEALKVMCTVGALGSEAQKLWCVHELGRLLDEFCPGELGIFDEVWK